MNLRQTAKYSKNLVNTVNTMSQEQLQKLVNSALDNCKGIYSKYFVSMLLQRIYNNSNKPAGSFIYDVNNEVEMEGILRSLEWEVEVADVKAGKIILKSKNPVSKKMKLGIIDLDNLPKDTTLKGLNPKDNPNLPESERPHPEVGFVINEKSFDLLPDADFIRLIIVTHDKKKKLMVVTFFPEITNAYPMRPSQLSPLSLTHGENLSISRAKELGYEYAKIATADAFTVTVK